MRSAFSPSWFQRPSSRRCDATCRRSSEALPLFEEFLRSVPVRVYRPAAEDRARAHSLADPKDVPILAAAIGAGAPLLVTHNVRHFRSGEGVRVVRPRTLIEEARAWMAGFGR